MIHQSKYNHYLILYFNRNEFNYQILDIMMNNQIEIT